MNGSCETCKFWSKPPKPEIETQIKHLEKLLAIYKSDKRFPDNVVNGISLEIIKMKNEAKKGSCWRFPQHVETSETHFCAEYLHASN